jgi:NADH dehydrogenase
MENVHALGDCAVLEGTAYPATAQVANQKAGWLAKRLNKGDLDSQGFTYKNLGVMAYVGNWNAIMQTDGGDVSGRVAWFIWRGAYLAKSVSWRNRILIPVYWFVNWVFGRDISRF